ncbi:MAG: STAS domain-containing protein [Acutalibacteraceae bacterium]|nr:STAS domain-containing protein [Acutalibacteraceae bacterium]
MTISKCVESDERVTLKVSGRLDTNSAPELDTELKRSVEGITELVFDLEGLEYISSAGLRVLLYAQKIMDKQGSMKLIHVSPVLMDIFEITDFVSILTIE